MADAPSQSKRPEDKAFQQQRLKAWQPLLTPKWVIGTFIVVGVIFIPIGAAILSASRGVVEVTQRYDELCGTNTCSGSSCTITNCTVSITIPEDMDTPIYVYYKLTNFYQNHRRYVKSRSDTQLQGENPSSISSCDPVQYDSAGLKIYPCGLIANSAFNDTIFGATVNRANATTLLAGNNWQQKGIAWSSDVDEKFKYDADWAAHGATRTGLDGVTLKMVTDEDFIVWMRTAGLPTFKKLYRKILDFSLKKGDVLTFPITSVFPVSSFNGEKAIVLSTTSWLGGKNDFLGLAYIIVGSLCLGLAVAFAIKHIVSPRPLGDMKYFNWPGSAPKSTARQENQ